MFLFAPSVGGPLQELGASLRTATCLSLRQRELGVIAIAAALDSEFELWAHLPIARGAGVEESVLQNVIHGRPLADSLEQALVEFCRAAAREAAPTAQFELLQEHFDRRALMEIIALVTYYRGLATMLALFGVGAPDDRS
nr:carboxymuconolactone decarboxylase family protein [Herbiconiux sp. KACC 21604]